MHSVVDTVGLNPLVRTLAVNGANAIAGMVEQLEPLKKEKRPSIALTEFGFCDKGAHYVRELLEKDYDLISFHATGLGDRLPWTWSARGSSKPLSTWSRRVSVNIFSEATAPPDPIAWMPRSGRRFLTSSLPAVLT